MARNFQEVDKLAAHRLLARLGFESSGERLELACEAFASHRTTACEGLVERAHRRIVDVLEATSIEKLAERSVSEDWVQGFSAAEEAVAMLEIDELTGASPDVELSKGQILRFMIRSARIANKTAS